MKKSNTGKYVGIGVVLYFMLMVVMYNKFTSVSESVIMETEEQIEWGDTLCVDTLQASDTVSVVVPQISTLITAMIQVESRGDDSAYCVSENAAGCLQIRPIMIAEVNRILKRNGVDDTYTLQDRWSRGKSIEILKVYKDYYHLDAFEEVARCWNGGPAGMSYSATAGYWKRVQNEMI
tara:strand:- start:221 stop:754 length:534 start_codon:yes stop_codon:yes gene_type:complete